MNRALLYLFRALLARKMLGFARSLRRPGTLLGFLAVLGLFGFLYWFRAHKVVGEVVRKESLIGLSLVMVCGSIFKGFLQRGLVCEPADLEFLFTGPFTQRQIIIYRLLPSYLYAVAQSVVFVTLFASHLPYPIMTGLCLTLLQITCFHLSTAAAIFGGGLPPDTHYRIRWMMLSSGFVIALLYLRLAWDFKIVPAFCAGPVFQLFFYPAISVPDVANAAVLHRWVLGVSGVETLPMRQFGINVLYLFGFGLAALGSLWAVLRCRSNVFEAALDTTTRVADQRQRLHQGRRLDTASIPGESSVPLPRNHIFCGVGAVVWKNLIAMKRSRREMLIAGFFILTYTGFFTALLWIYREYERKAGVAAPLYEAQGFTTGIAMFLGMLAFFLQRMFPFDFRRDGNHLLNFRTLPTSPLAIALAEIAVPTALCVAAQACGVIPLIFLGKFDWPTMILVVMGYPAVSLALNSVWNLHYLLAATRRTQGRSETTSAAGMVMVVALSFLVFYPAGWTTIKIANALTENHVVGFALAAVGGLTVQYAIDLFLILGMAKLFQNFEVSHSS